MLGGKSIFDKLGAQEMLLAKLSQGYFGRQSFIECEGDAEWGLGRFTGIQAKVKNIPYDIWMDESRPDILEGIYKIKLIFFARLQIVYFLKCDSGNTFFGQQMLSGLKNDSKFWRLQIMSLYCIILVHKDMKNTI